MNKKMLSIIIPTYNEKEYLLRQAIETMLNQTYQNIELIIIDDGCTDNTPEVLKEYMKQDNRLRVFRKERNTHFRTIAEAFNIGLREMKGDYWHHDAADCWHDKTFAENIITFLDGRTDVIGAHTDFAIHYYDENRDEIKNKVKEINTNAVWKKELTAFENYLRFDHFGGMVFTKDACNKAGLWDARFPRHQTREWTLRILKLGELVYIPRVLWHFIYHEVDQLKRIASIKYRILASLKNGFTTQWDMGNASQAEWSRFAVAEAYREFFTEPQWEPERNNGYTIDKIRETKINADKEASETWAPEMVRKVEYDKR